MRPLRTFVGALLGGLLLYVALIELRGFLAARPIPEWYFPLFGENNAELALAFIGVLVHLLPEGLFIAVAMLLTVRLLSKEDRTMLVPVVCGMVVCYLALLAIYGAHISAVEWWSIPIVVSPLVGLLFGAWLCRRTRAPTDLADA